MSAAAELDLETPLAAAMAKVDELESVLEEEFAALKVQDLDRFEQLLRTKTICCKA